MRIVRHAAIAALLITSAISGPVLAAGPTATQKKAAKALITLSQLNLAVKEDWKFNGGGEVEGKVYVGGNVLKTGGADTTQIGFGASNHQGTASSAFASVTVGGYTDIGFQIKNQVGGSYGAYIAGSVNNQNAGIEIQENNATVKIGGNVNGKVAMTQGSTLWVAGNYNNQNGVSLSDNNTVWIGGNSTRIQGGNSGLSVKVGGNLASIDLNSGSAQIGGTLGAGGGNSNVRGNLTALGNISNLGMNGNGLTVKSGGSISNISISNASNVYAANSISVQNNNGGANAVHANCGATYSASNCAGQSAPTSPGVPVVGGLSTQTSTMFDNFAALQTTLANLSTVGHLGTVAVTNGSGQNGQAYTFSTGSSSGYTVFNVTESIFSLKEFEYNFSNITTPVVINVRNTGGCATTSSCSYDLDENFINGSPTFNRNVIWNFADASSVVLNKQFQGSVVAALADLRANVIEGSVVTKNFTMTNEIHLGTFNRNDGNSFLLTGVVPEPANWLMMIAGFGMIGAAIRRRRTFAVAA